MLKLALLVVAFASIAGAALAQSTSTPDEPRVTGDENEPYYPTYVYPTAPCAGGRSLIGGASSGADGPSDALTVTREGEATVLTFNKDHQTWEEALGFRYDSSHAMDSFTYKSSKDISAHSIVARVHGVTEFRDANGNGVMDESDVVLQEFLVADDEDLLAAMPQGDPGEPARSDEPLRSSSANATTSQPASPQPMEEPSTDSPYLLHMARDWRSPCAVQFKWTYFLTLDIDSFQDKLEKRDRAVFADEPRLALQFTHVGAPFDAAGVALVPERVKIDIGIDHFPFSAPDSLLGVRVTILSQDELQKDAAGVSGAAGDSRVGFAWATTALADGKVEKVGAYAEAIPVPEWHLDAWTKDARSAMLVTFTYPHAESILHDPEVGKFAATETTVPPPETVEVSTVGVLVLVSIAGLLALVGRRR